MLLKLPIILSSNSFYFNPLFPKLYIPSIKHYTISLIYIAMLKITIYLTYTSSPKRFVVPSISIGYFSVDYVVMDTSNIVLWVLVCVWNMQDFAVAAF